jgi:plastocyanin domain-containing protein
MRIFSLHGRVTSLAIAITFACAAIGAGVCGCDRKSDATADSVPVPAPAPGEMRITASEHGFVPSELSIPKGQPGSLAKVTFVRTTDQTCATEVVFPDLDIKKPLPLGQLVAVDVPSDSAKTLTFQCGMGMYKGALLVK